MSIHIFIGPMKQIHKYFDPVFVILPLYTPRSNFSFNSRGLTEIRHHYSRIIYTVTYFQILQSNWTVDFQAVSWPVEAFFLITSGQNNYNGLDLIMSLFLHFIAFYWSSQCEVQRVVDACEGSHLSLEKK